MNRGCDETDGRLFYDEATNFVKLFQFVQGICRTTGSQSKTVSLGYYCPVHMLGTMRLHNASFPSGRTRELCLDFFAAVATLNSLRDANLWGRGSMFEQRRGS